LSTESKACTACLAFMDATPLLHEISTHINVYICKVGMPPSQPLIFPIDPLE